VSQLGRSPTQPGSPRSRSLRYSLETEKPPDARCSALHGSRPYSFNCFPSDESRVKFEPIRSCIAASELGPCEKFRYSSRTCRASGSAIESQVREARSEQEWIGPMGERLDRLRRFAGSEYGEKLRTLGISVRRECQPRYGSTFPRLNLEQEQRDGTPTMLAKVESP
jgi:hypothetical protein